MPTFALRSPEKEVMDLRDFTPEEAAPVYRLIGLVNRHLGGAAVILRELERFWPNGSDTVRILDVATGGGDIPVAIARWARPRKLKVRIVGLDLNAGALAYARQIAAEFPEISFVRGSCFELPFREKTFDFAMSSMFFHHLTEDGIREALRHFNVIVRRGIIINDLLRAPLAYYGFRLLAAFSGNATFQNDGALSVLRGFRGPELEALARESGLAYLQCRRRPVFRLSLAGVKDGTL